MTFRRRFLPALLIGAIALTPLSAQRRDPTPEQRIDRLEKQVRQVQKQVFPKGQPAATAGFDDAPAATQASVVSLSQRLDSIEQQMSQLVRATEENGNRLATVEAEVARLRAEQDRRLRALENGAAAPATNDQATDDQATDGGGDSAEADGPPPAPQPKFETAKPAAEPAAIAATPAGDPAEAAYDAGYRLWLAGKYDPAIAALQKVAKDFPSHRRASWAYNLAGRAMLDKGQPRAAAEALLANYRRDPKGERAQDSLFYLGKSLVKLGQPGQACKAYSELEAVYGANVRAPLKAELPSARAEAKC